jgi:Chalcone isomerase-like
MGGLALSLRARLSRGLAAAIAVVALGGGAVEAAEVAGVTFAGRVRAGEQALVLVDVAALRWKLVFRPYAGAFYIAPGVEPGRWREDVPKRLELAYFYSFAGKDFGPAGEEVLARNVAPEAMAALRERLAEIARLYVDVVPGDRYALTYLPGRGTELAKNGHPLGVVAGSDFAAAYFSIWLGEDPISAAFRDRLLSKR